MTLDNILDIAAGIANVGEPLWTLLSEGTIPDEQARKAMKLQALQFELEAGAARDEKETKGFRTLRHFLTNAPVGVQLDNLTIADNGRITKAVA